MVVRGLRRPVRRARAVLVLMLWLMLPLGAI
jgi:hypothetical protein